MSLQLKAIEIGGTLLNSLAPAAVWRWMTGRGSSRAGTFFGTRVEAGFAESCCGQAILRQFRQRLWLWSLAGMAACMIAIAAAPGTAFSKGVFAAASLIGTSAGMAAFALAHRRTGQEAIAPAEPAIRIASLAADEGPEDKWLWVLDWLAMLAPPAVPLATLILISFYWHRFPLRAGEGWEALGAAILALSLGLFVAVNHWALLYRTRSSDWARTTNASHRYRTYLGLPMATLMTVLIAELCATSLMPLKGSVGWLRGWDLVVISRAFLPCLLAVGVFGWSVRVWLSKHRDRESSDPMADKYWKWGQFYCNPGDPAIMVPMRTGDMYSPNYSRPSVWVVCGTVFVVLVGFFVQQGYATRVRDRETKLLERQIQQEVPE
jgi:hypothetical protein